MATVSNRPMPTPTAGEQNAVDVRHAQRAAAAKAQTRFSREGFSATVESDGSGSFAVWLDPEELDHLLTRLELYGQRG